MSQNENAQDNEKNEAQEAIPQNEETPQQQQEEQQEQQQQQQPNTDDIINQVSEPQQQQPQQQEDGNNQQAIDNNEPVVVNNDEEEKHIDDDNADAPVDNAVGEEVGETVDEPDEPELPSPEEEKEPDIFAPEFDDKEFIGNPNYTDTKILPTENFNSDILPKRKFLYKILITRPKRDFEAPIINAFQDKNANEESTAGNNEVKGVKSVNDYPLQERPYIEMGFQTPNRAITRTYQVSRKEYKNSYTQVERNFGDIRDKMEHKRHKYLTDTNMLISVENFLNKVRPRMEQSLKSNETINILSNDFDLEKNSQVQSDDKKKNGQQENRTFRDNSAGNKSKKEKGVHIIRGIKETDAFIAHSLMRNFTFDEHIKINGIPYQSQILFWNIKDIEQNSPIFAVETQSEVTCFEFDESNCDNMACALASGQIMFVYFRDLLGILRAHANEDYVSYSKKINIKDYYIYKISSLKGSHKGRVSAIKWMPKGYYINKKNQAVHSPEYKESGVVVTLGEDGRIILWDYKGIELATIKEEELELNLTIKNIQIEVNRVDAIGKMIGTGLDIDIRDGKVLFYVSTDEGQVYAVDMLAKNTSDNPSGNVVQHYYNRYFRPVLYFETSPHFDNIFITVHDFHFCLWDKQHCKPIFISPNLKKSSYTCGKFSPSRPGVLYLCRSNGKIDIWDFLDESHKPSVKDSFIKEQVSSFYLFKYVQPPDENAEKATPKEIEYMLVGDNSGQMTVLEVPTLFRKSTQDEKIIMDEFFKNEISRQEYMDKRYKKLEEDIQNRDPKDKEETGHERELELKYQEETFQGKRKDILVELGITVPKTEEELMKEKMEQENQ